MNMLNYKLSEEAAALAASEKLTFKEVRDMVVFMMGFIVCTATLIWLPMVTHMI